MEHYILEGVTDALFLDSSKLPQIELVIQDKCWGDTTGYVIYYSVVCCEGTLCPLRTLYGCTIYSCVGVSLFVLITKAVEGLEEWDKQMQAPTFLYVGES